MLREMPAGTVFTPNELHVTILPWFVSDQKEPEVIASFIEQFNGQKIFRAKVGSEVLFGPKKDVPVNLVESEGVLLSLHHQGLNLMAKLKGRWAVKNPHVGGEYVPHIRKRGGEALNRNDKIIFNQISLIKAARSEDNRREIAATVDLV